MTCWTTEELSQIAAADELQLVTPRSESTMRRPVPIWVVRHGDALYVRSYRGENGGWYQGAQQHNWGHISVNAVDTDVTFTHVVDREVNAEVDAAYRNKYARYGPRFLEPMTAPIARATTLKLIPVRKGT